MPTGDAIDCPDSDALSALASGGLEGPRRGEVLAHLDDCAACRRLVALAVTGDGGVASDSPVLHPGQRFGRYTVDELLGGGAMGVVYSASDPALGRKVALKVVRGSEDTSVDAASARLLREAKAAATLSHPNVVVVYEVGEFEGRVFIAMELVEEGTLVEWLTGARREREEILDMFLQAGEGLAAAHDAGLVHRDFKPANVLVGRDGRPRVADFGLAKPSGSPVPLAPGGLSTSNGGEGASLTRTGAAAGTPAYMAPELLRGAAADARCDQFAFAVSLVEALCGKRPYDPGDLALWPDGRPLLVAPSFATLPARLQGVLLRALSLSPEERFPDMRSVLAALRELRTFRRTRLRPSVRAAMVTAFIVTIVVGVSVALFRSHRGSEDIAALPVADSVPGPPSVLPTPASLPGLVLWLDGTHGLRSRSDGHGVEWTDRSPNHNDAQSTGSPRVVQDAIAGKPGVRFDGGGYLRVLDSTSLHLANDDFVEAVVVRHTTSTDAGPWGYGCLVCKQLDKYPWAGPALVANSEERESNLLAQMQYATGQLRTTRSGMNDGTPFLAIMRRAAISDGIATLNVRVNRGDVGAVTGKDFAFDASASGEALFIGGTSHSQNLVGYVAEVVIARGALSNDEFDGLEAYLMSKYGLHTRSEMARLRGD